MHKLINRITWVLSFLIGMFLSFVFDVDNIGFVYVSIIFGVLFKLFIFSDTFIKNSLEEKQDSSFQKTPISEGEEQDLKGEEKDPKKTNYFNEAIKEEKIAVDEEEEFQYNENMNLQNKEEMENKKEEKNEPREPNFLEKFFADNVLAKIGGIFLFLGVLFFLSLLYTSVGPVLKIIIGFFVGILFFFVGIFLDKKGYKNESRVLLGLAILVNYLVILSGRYLIGGKGYLTEGVTFLFLILNTIFAIITSLVYKSKTLLIFSFVFAYLNPFLMGSKGDGTPYTLVGYSMIVSLGSLILSHIYYTSGEKNIAKYLSFVGIIGGNILFLLAPFSVVSEWILKLICMGIISFLSIILAYKNDEKKGIGILFFLNYFFFGILLISGGVANILGGGISFLGYISFLMISLFLSVFVISTGAVVSLSYMLFAPLIIVILLLFTGYLYFIIPLLLGTLFVYLIIFSFLYQLLSISFRYIFFVILSIFLFFSNFYLKFGIPEGLVYTNYISIIISAFIFLFSAYFFSRKKDMEYLYTIGTLGTIFLLFPIISLQKDFLFLSALSVIIFGITNIVTPFFNRNLYSNGGLKNLLISLVVGIIFIAGELYNFGEIAKLFPGLILGFSFACLAIIYFILAYILIHIFGIKREEIMSSENEKNKNVILGYSAISLSLFSIAMLIIFASSPAIVASIWLFEATILFYFHSKIKENNIFGGAMILFLVGVIKYFYFIETIQEGDLLQFVPIIAIVISFILNLKFLENEDKNKRLLHDIFHIIAIFLLVFGITKIINSSENEVIFSLSVYLFILGIIYNFYSSLLLQYVFIFFLCLFYVFHISIDIENDFKYLSYGALLFPFLWLYFKNLSFLKFKDFRKFLISSYTIYVFIFTTKALYDFTNANVFIISIYWVLWSLFYILNGTHKDNKRRRTIGLYILLLVIIKVLFSDIWIGIDNPIFRIIALMFVGAIMIYISTLYSHKFSGNLLKELDINNLEIFPKEKDIKKTQQEESKNNSDEGDTYNSPQKKFVINEQIDKLELSSFKSVIFKVNNGKTFKIRSKNLIKIAKLIEKNKNKNIFEPGELKQVYSYVVNNYKTELKKEDYDKILTIVQLFVENGGTITFEEL